MKTMAWGLRILATVLTGVFLLGSLTACSSGSAKEVGKERKKRSVLASLHEDSGGRASRERESYDSGTAKSLPASRGLVRQNVPADFNPDIESPAVGTTSFVDPLASVIGHVEVGERVYFAPFSSARGDEGQPIHIGNESNLQDGVVIHALETVEHGNPRPENTYEVNGKRYAVYIGERVSLAHQSHVHGPAWIEQDTFIGMQALVFKAHIGRGVVVEPAATIIGVTIPPGRYVSAGSVVTDQQTANQLPKITSEYAFRTINKAVVHVNTSLADGYSGRSSSATTSAAVTGGNH